MASNSNFPSSEPIKNSNVLPATVGLGILLCGLLCAAWLGRVQADRNADVVRRQTRDQAQRIAAELPLRIQAYEKGVRGMRGAILVGGQEHISLATFLVYAHSRDIASEFPGANGFGFIRRVAAADEAAFIDEARRTIDPNFAIRRIQHRSEEGFIVTLLETGARDAVGRGLDVASDPEMRRAALIAMQSGRAALSAPIEDPDASAAGDKELLLFLPAFRPGMATASIGDRTAATIGWAFATLHAREVLQGLSVVNFQQYTLSISDVTDDGDSAPFFISERSVQQTASRPFQHVGFPIYGRQWRISVQPTDQMLASLHLVAPRSVSILGSLLSLLASALGVALTLIAQRRRELQQARKAQFRLALEAAPTGMLMIDDAGTIVIVNRQVEVLFGYERAELLGQDIEILIPPRFRSHHTGLRQGFFLKPQTRIMGDGRELYGLHKDGREVPIEIGLNPLRTAEGQFVLSSIADISDRKRTAERDAQRTAELARANAILEQKNREVQANEKKFRLLVEGVADYAIFMLDAGGHVAGWNSGAQRIKGYEEREILGQHYSKFYTDEDRAAGKPARQLKIATAQGRVVDEGWRLRKDGSRFIANVVITAVRDNTGELLGFANVTRDITAQRQAERELSASEARYRLLVEDQSEMISLATIDGTLSFVNQAYADVFGLQPGQIVGTNLYDYLPESERPNVREHLGRVCAGRAVSCENWMLAANGELRWIAWRNRALTDAQGQIVGIHSVGRDITERRNAEKALLESEERFRGAFEFATIGMALVAPTGRWLRVNRSLCQIVGYTEEELLATDFQTISHPDDLASDADHVARILAGSLTHYHLQKRYLHKDGHVVWIDLSVSLVRDAAGVPLYFVALIQDITDHRQAELQLRTSESFLTRTGAVAGVGGWEIDLASNTLTWSAQTKRLHGVAADYVPTYEKAMQFYTPESRALVEKVLLDCVDHGRPFDVELELVFPGRGQFWARATGAAEFQDGKAARIVGAFQDITERRRDALKLRELSSLLTSVLDSASEVAIIATDADMNITLFNAGAERLLGYIGREVVGIATPMLFHDREEVRRRGEQLSARFGRAFEGPAIFTDPSTLRQPHEWTFIRKDGVRLAASLVVTAIYPEDGRISGYVGIAHDITRQAQYEQSLRLAMSQAEKANAAKSEFLANMSHEIRTPLNAVIGLGYLLEQTSLTDDQRQFVTKIQFAGRSLLSVVNNVLDLSKIEAGEMQLEEETFDLPLLFDEIGQMLLPQALAKGIELMAQPAPSLPRTVKGDVARLRQVLTNLVNNSIKFTSTGGVTVAAWCTEQMAGFARLRCEVRDTGIGIESGVLERLFTPFTQADASTTRRFGGTGLGLSIARRFVELMGGSIGVSSTVGVGSTFWFEIPLELALVAGAEKTRERSREFRILIADPAAEPEGGLGAMVRAIGWTPEIAASEQAFHVALERARESLAADVLIVDLGITDDDPGQLLERIRRGFGKTAPPPIIIIADGPQICLQYESFVRAQDTFLVRPVNGSALFNAINAALWKQNDGQERLLLATQLDEFPAQWLAGVRVLVADDSDINLEVARRILGKQGALVATVSDGQAAVEYVREHSLDVVLMDIQMPVLDGNQATQQIRQELHLLDLPIVALTAGALLGERQRSLASGMNDFISKPFDPLALIRKVRHLVEQARGEPIKMVLIEPASPAASHELRMPSIDAGVVRQMFGEDLSLFRSILSRMLRDFADLALPVCVSLEDPAARDGLMARTHKLKGSAGMLGATGVMQLAGAAENALRNARPVDVLESILRQLASAFTTLCEEARPFLAQADELLIAPKAAGSRHEPVNIEELLELLETQNLSAVDKASEYSASLESLLGAAVFKQLSEAVEQLEFDRAAALLRDTATEAMRQRA